MGGGGGFVGTIVNGSLPYGSVQSGYATVGTDTGHQGNSLDTIARPCDLYYDTYYNL